MKLEETTAEIYEMLVTGRGWDREPMAVAEKILEEYGPYGLDDVMMGLFDIDPRISEIWQEFVHDMRTAAMEAKYYDGRARRWEPVPFDL